jgi:hypothetical protein
MCSLLTTSSGGRKQATAVWASRQNDLGRRVKADQANPGIIRRGKW